MSGHCGTNLSTDAKRARVHAHAHTRARLRRFETSILHPIAASADR
jgi:hypothetical protein